MPHASQASAGIGLRAPHIGRFQALRPRVPFIEVHTENYLCGGPMRAALRRIRLDYDISLHCVGLSVGSAAGVDETHLERVAELVKEIDPMLVSDHLSVATLGSVYTNDLIAVPYNEEALTVTANHVDRIQEVLGRTILVENPSRYLAYEVTSMEEGDFLAQLARRTGCGVLCDVNNIYVSARNFGSDPFADLARFPVFAVKQIHIAGHETSEDDGAPLLIDTHDRPACDDVLELFRVARAQFGALPALMEWDAQLPDLEVLLAEAQRVERFAAPEAVHAVA